MNMIRFKWDENKNSINKKKHGISFEEASSVFYDDNALVIGEMHQTSGLDSQRKSAIALNGRFCGLLEALCVEHLQVGCKIHRCFLYSQDSRDIIANIRQN